MPNSTYGKFVTMQRSNPTPPYLFEIYSAERFRGIECALWPTLYYDLSRCESAIEGTESRESGVPSKVLLFCCRLPSKLRIAALPV